MMRTISNHKGQNGFSLLEVILAATMLSGILLAASHLDLAAIRLTNVTNDEVALRNDLLYAIRVLEKDIQETDEEIQIVMPGTANPVTDAHYEFTLIHSDGSPDINYVIDLTPGGPEEMIRTEGTDIKNLFPEDTTPPLTPIVIPKLQYANGAPQPPISIINGKIIMLHFAAETTPFGGSSTLKSSASKSILVRTATITGGAP